MAVEHRDPDWWRIAFTPEDFAELQTKTSDLVGEFGIAVEDMEPIAVVVLVTPTEFGEALRLLARLDSDGYDLQTIGLAFAQEYFDNDDIDQNDELSVAAREFYTPYDQDDEDD